MYYHGYQYIIDVLDYVLISSYHIIEKQMAPVATFIPAMLALIASWQEEFMFFCGMIMGLE